MNGRFLLDPLIRALEGEDRLISEAQAILAAHLEPDGLTEKQTIDRLLELLDGPEQRRIREATLKALHDCQAHWLTYRSSAGAAKSPRGVTG